MKGSSENSLSELSVTFDTSYQTLVLGTLHKLPRSHIRRVIFNYSHNLNCTLYDNTSASSRQLFSMVVWRLHDWRPPNLIILNYSCDILTIYKKIGKILGVYSLK